jgi:hypothetical protein
MKTSNKILMVTGAAVLAFIIAVVIISRVMVGNIVTFEGEKDKMAVSDGEKVSNNPEVGTFTELKIVGAWEVRIEKGDDHSITVTAADSIMEKLRVESRGNTLNLNYPLHSSISSRGAKAVIRMPELERIESKGGTSIQFSGFTIDRLEVDLEGASNLKGEDSDIEDLFITAEGATNVDCGNCEIVNAHLDVEGAGSVKLRMNGGNLTGTVAGLANVVYIGTVKRETIKVDGLGSVKHR